MVKAYLENLKEDFLQQKQLYELKISNLELKLKENEEFQKVIQKDEDLNYELFTPREINKENKLRLLDLEEQKNNILSLIEAEQDSCEKCCKKIEELDQLINYMADSLLEKEKKEKADEWPEIFRIRLLETQENERQRISRELHDDTVQNLTSLIHRVELCSKLVEIDTVRCKLELVLTEKFLHEVICDIRKMIYDLRPMTFDDIGLDVTIARALEKLESHSTRKLIHFQVEGTSYNLQSVVGITILRIIQEACSNALRHANATSIHVLLKYEPEQIYIEIKDNGYGFDLDHVSGTKLKNNSGYGLAMMKERVFLLSGNIDIESEIGVGTNIKVTVPVEKGE